MALTIYSTGTVSVDANGAVTVVGGIWSGPNVVAGDVVSIDGGAALLLSDVSDVTHGQLVGWTGGAVSGKPYVAYQCSSLRFDDVQIAQDLQKQVAALNTEGFYIFVPDPATAPDPSLGDNGQYAFQPTTGKWWVKSAGLWTLVGSPYGLQPAAALSEIAALGKQAEAQTNLGGTTIGKTLFAAANEAAALAVLPSAYRKNNILGTVSQLAGVPTGAVVEYGSNANGSYIRWADGTQICFGKPVANLAINQGIGSIYRSSHLTWTFPAAFIDANTVVNHTYDGNYDGNPGGATGNVYGLDQGSVQLNLISGPSLPAANRRIHAHAIGRWF